MTGKPPLRDVRFSAISNARAGARSRKVEIPCPICGPQHQGASARRKVMATWALDGGGFSVGCARCGIEGWVAPDEGATRRPERPAVSVAAPDEEEERKRRRNAELAEKIWCESSSITATAGEAYLAKRGIELAAVPNYGGLRWHPRCPWGSGTTGCIISRFTDTLTGERRGIHRRPIDGQKPRTLGPMGGCVIRLWSDELVTTGLVLGEGIETVLAAATRIPHRGALLQPAWAAGSAGNLEDFGCIFDQDGNAVVALAGIEVLTVLVDNDPSGAGQESAWKCAQRWRAAGREAIRLIPDRLGDDFNDVVRRSP
jgi:hypothetical protein